MQRHLLVLILAVAALALVAASASAIPMRNAKVTLNNGSVVRADATAFLPPSAKYCHAFVRAYLITPSSSGTRLEDRLGKYRMNFRPCVDGEYLTYSFWAQFRNPDSGRHKVCFEAWTPLTGGAISRHYTCTGEVIIP